MEFLPSVFAKGHHPISYGIRAVTWSRWSHCGALHEGDLWFRGKLYTGLKVLEAVGGKGVIVTPWAEFRARYKDEHIAFGLVPVLDSRDDAYQRAISELGLEYDFSMLLGNLLRTGWDHPDKRSCSEYMANASRIFRMERIVRVTPEDLWMIAQPWHPNINNIVLPL